MSLDDYDCNLLTNYNDNFISIYKRTKMFAEYSRTEIDVGEINSPSTTFAVIIVVPGIGVWFGGTC